MASTKLPNTALKRISASDAMLKIVPAAPETSAQTPDAAAPSPASSVAEGMEKAAEGAGR